MLGNNDSWSYWKNFILLTEESSGEEDSSCDLDNGGCQHDCVVEGSSHVCKCKDGYKLQDDGKTCAGFIIFML